ncbi:MULTISPECIES: MFS transporter [Anoxybacillus]|uniref:MFS transporter n=1 Tax=Anoxybacillus flavithermus TaxID=33934 RepID=A0A178TI07_9BACL|nr:MFS transporter [Anoxybacillus flavithermus]ELK23048.1 transport protein, major Facilitator Superfamily [Anoxybacillus flavithermus TNO-09.006]MBE2907604.1 MFS transporter [Anoxybacillus flavithermus]MBE2910875.1 MFS transporter [Anoxybacillus flavithermus]MBE2915949.1 MFS transporter [Anoxybacillus flavithermus]MBE2918922.1 MFS transporter [Anoxybacillus flavithermus]
MRQRHFFILISSVMISGLAQGLLLPLISVIFEQNGVHSSLSGMHATAMYIGVLIVSPLLERPLRRYGFKRLTIIGGAIVIVSLAIFPIWSSLLFWFMLRLLIGIGDHIFHFGTQTWITYASPAHRRGRNISLYGLSFGVGFMIGPLLVPLVHVHETLPFIVSSLISLCGWVLLFFLPHAYPETEQAEKIGTLRFFHAWKQAWPALLLPFGYGFLEASLHSMFPIYALRNGLHVETVAIMLPAFALGGIAFQLPLGVLSDRFSRKAMITVSLTVGSICFIIAQWFISPVPLTVTFFVAGMFVGSLFSLGMAYMTDLLPKSLLPVGNILCGMLYSIGSICGPAIGGIVLQQQERLFFFSVSSLLFLLLLAQRPLTKFSKYFSKKTRKKH